MACCEVRLGCPRERRRERVLHGREVRPDAFGRQDGRDAESRHETWGRSNRYGRCNARVGWVPRRGAVMAPPKQEARGSLRCFGLCLPGLVHRKTQAPTRSSRGLPTAPPQGFGWPPVAATGLPAVRAEGFSRQPMATGCLCEADGRDAWRARPGAQESRLKLGPCGM